MHLLVTGSTGFVGSYFLQHEGKAHTITTFSFLSDDFDTLDLTGIDAVIHLAALVHQMDGASEDAYRKANVENTLMLAQKAKVAGVAHFLFMSTVKVYGEESDTPYTLQTPCHPQDPYGESKHEAENALRLLEDESFHVAIIRPPVVYGQGVKGNIRNLVRLIERIPLIPLSGIKNRRSIVFVGNLCAMIGAILQQKASGTYLAADRDPVSTTGLAKGIARALGKKRLFLRIPFFESLLRRFKPALHARLYGSLTLDTSQSEQTLQFAPPYTTEEGLSLMIGGSHVDA